MNETIRLGLIMTISVFLIVISLVVIINKVFPATWSCEYNHNDNVCWCAWDNRPTNEWGFNYTEQDCNDIGRVVR